MTAVQIALEIFAQDGKISRESVIALSSGGPTPPLDALQVEVPVEQKLTATARITGPAAEPGP